MRTPYLWVWRTLSMVSIGLHPQLSKRAFTNDRTLENLQSRSKFTGTVDLAQIMATPLAQTMATDQTPNQAVSNRKGAENHQEKQGWENHSRQKEGTQESKKMTQKLSKIFKILTFKHESAKRNNGQRSHKRRHTRSWRQVKYSLVNTASRLQQISSKNLKTK